MKLTQIWFSILVVSLFLVAGWSMMANNGHVYSESIQAPIPMEEVQYAEEVSPLANPLSSPTVRLMGGIDFAVIASHHSGGQAGYTVSNGTLENPTAWTSGFGGVDQNPTLTAHPDLAMGDVDGDGLDEMITTAQGKNTIAYDDRLADHEPMGIIFPGSNHSFVAVGNLDGDISDEIVLITSDEIHVFDDAATEFVELAVHDPGEVVITGVATGDIDGDDRHEIIIVGNNADERGYPNGWSYDLNGTGLDLIRRYTGNQFGGRWTNPQDVVVDTGDIDGDGIDELLFAYSYDLGVRNEFQVYDDIRSGRALPLHYGPLSTGIGHIPRIALGDIDADGLDEIMYTTRSGYGEGFGFDFGYREDGLGCTISGCNSANTYRSLGQSTTPGHRPDVFSGDFNQDGLSDLVLTHDHWDGVRNRIYTRVYDQSLTQLGESFDDYAVADTGIGANWDEFYYAAAVGDMNGDALTLRYTGETHTYTQDPQPLMVLAAPPNTFFLDTNTEDAGTGFGPSNETKLSGVDVWADAFISTEFPPGDLEGLEPLLNRTLLNELEATGNNTIHERLPEYMGSGEIEVIYSEIEWTYYVYEFVGHPNSTRIGDQIQVQIPDLGIKHNDLETYNGEFGGGLSLGDGVIGNEAGMVSSYDDRQALTQLANTTPDHGFRGWIISEEDEKQLGQGASATSTEIDLATVVDPSDDLSWEVNSHAAALEINRYGEDKMWALYGPNGTGGVRFAHDTTYNGTVGHILESEEWKEHRFDFGLVVYSQNHENYAAPFLVVNYYVEGYDGEEVPPTTYVIIEFLKSVPVFVWIVIVLALAGTGFYGFRRYQHHKDEK